MDYVNRTGNYYVRRANIKMVIKILLMVNNYLFIVPIYALYS